MENGKRKSALGMMLVVGGMAAAVPAASVADPRPAANSKTAVVQCNGRPQAGAKAASSTSSTARCDGKPQPATSQKDKGFFCNMAPKASQKNKGFYCNMAPKADRKAKTEAPDQTKTGG